MLLFAVQHKFQLKNSASNFPVKASSLTYIYTFLLQGVETHLYSNNFRECFSYIVTVQSKIFLYEVTVQNIQPKSEKDSWMQVI